MPARTRHGDYGPAHPGAVEARAGRRAAGDVGAGRSEVATALSLGAHERIRRPFAHVPAEIRSMIRTDPELMSRADWLRPEPAAAAIRPKRPTQVATLVGPNLTARELEVLRLLSSLLRTEEIAAELFISVNTVRTHVRRIFESSAFRDVTMPYDVPENSSWFETRPSSCELR